MSTDELSYKVTYAKSVELREQGRYEEAIDLLTTHIERYGDNPTALALISHCYILSEQLERAEFFIQRAKEIGQSIALLGWNEARLLLKKQDFDAALKVAKNTWQHFQDDAEGLSVLGACFRANDNLVESEKFLNQAISKDPRNAEAYINRGLVRISRSDNTGGLDDLLLAHQIKPHIYQIWELVLSLTINAGKFIDAIALLKGMISISPKNEFLYASSALCHQKLNNFTEAVRIYRYVISINPNLPEVYNNMGNSLHALGEIEEAIEVFRKALDLKPDLAEAHNNLGNALKAQGKITEAMEAYSKALDLKPDFASAHRNLSSIKKYNCNDWQISVCTSLLAGGNLSLVDTCQLNFALAKMLEDVNAFDEAFSHYVEGNLQRKKLLNYSFEQDKVFFQALKMQQIKIKGVFADQISEPAGVVPIFIVGMPRSGTSLVEQIVSAHSEVVGAGELDYIARLGVKLSTGSSMCTVEAILEFREMYLKKLLQQTNSLGFVTDKMPLNFRYIPLICEAFPEAKILHVKRDARATCWSNFKQYFVTDAMKYSYNLKDTVNYYNLYQDMMQHWHEEYPSRIYNVEYDKLTVEKELQIKHLIEFLGLQLEDSCLTPELNDRPVLTASNSQIRKKIYRGSSEEWLKFEKYLNPIFSLLK